MQTQVQVMLELQDSMNCCVHAQWREQHYAWYRAIWIECAELMDHYGWKWWKHQKIDEAQVALELIDIWHFGLSLLLESGVGVTEISEELASAFSVRYSADEDFRELLEAFVSDTLTNKQFSIALFVPLLRSVNMNFEDLYRAYVGKNVLNRFRQDKGYKTGDYIKVWSGREDNEHLVELAQCLDTTEQDFFQRLYAALDARYAMLS